ncbi:MAG: hypothetical protein N2C14_30270, partial [Planctomycetales bacterium]
MIWERQSGEQTVWFERFERYRMLGPERSASEIYRQEMLASNPDKPPGRIPANWRNAVEKWEWESRAAAWDDEHRQRTAREMETARLEAMKLQIRLLSAYQAKI